MQDWTVTASFNPKAVFCGRTCSCRQSTKACGGPWFQFQYLKSQSNPESVCTLQCLRQSFQRCRPGGRTRKVIRVVQHAYRAHVWPQKLLLRFRDGSLRFWFWQLLERRWYPFLTVVTPLLKGPLRRYQFSRAVDTRTRCIWVLLLWGQFLYVLLVLRPKYTLRHWPACIPEPLSSNSFSHGHVGERERERAQAREDRKQGACQEARG